MGKKKGKGGDLGGLAGAFVKAGLSSEKQAQSSRRERAQEDRELGRAGRAEREAERAAAEARRREEAAERDRQRVRGAGEQAELEGLRNAIAAQAETARGPRRWFFVARDGRIPFVEISDALSRMLTDGHAGIVESLGALADDHVVVSGRPVLTRLAEADPELVRFWNRSGGRS